MKRLLEIVNTKGFDKLIGMLILVLCLCFMGGVGIFYLITKTSMDPISMIVTGLITTATNLVGYYWGSSSSSRDKDDTISNLTKNGN